MGRGLDFIDDPDDHVQKTTHVLKRRRDFLGTELLVDPDDKTDQPDDSGDDCCGFHSSTPIHFPHSGQRYWISEFPSSRWMSMETPHVVHVGLSFTGPSRFAVLRAHSAE